MKLPACSWSFFACSVPLRTCSVGLSSGWICGDQVRLLDARTGLDADRVELADLVEELLRGGLVEDREGRAADAHVGNSAMPVISSCRAGPNAWTPIRSPTSKPFAAAVALSITIWSLPRGQLPR